MVLLEPGRFTLLQGRAGPVLLGRGQGRHEITIAIFVIAVAEQKKMQP